MSLHDLSNSKRIASQIHADSEFRFFLALTYRLIETPNSDVGNDDIALTQDDVGDEWNSVIDLYENGAVLESYSSLFNRLLAYVLRSHQKYLHIYCRTDILLRPLCWSL